MKSDLTVYLAGKMSGLTYDEMNEWRLNIKGLLEMKADMIGKTITTINPVSFFNFEEKRHQNEIEIMKFDLAKVKSSDIIVVNMKGLNTSIASTIELYEAYKQEIPIIAIGSEEEFNSLHPWVQICITRYGDLEDTINYIEDFYLT